MNTTHRTIVSGLIFSSDGKLLMGKKDPKKGGVYANCWHLPGGGVDDRETLAQAVVREIREEVGIAVKEAQCVLIDDKGSGESIKTIDGEEVLCQMQFNVFRIELATTAEETSVILNDDLVEYGWFAPEELRAAKLTPPSVELFMRLGYLS